MAFASGGPGAHPGGNAPGAQAAAGGAFSPAQSGFQNLLNVAGQALQQIGLPQGGMGQMGGGMGQPMMGQQMGLHPAMAQMLSPFMAGRY